MVWVKIKSWKYNFSYVHTFPFAKLWHYKVSIGRLQWWSWNNCYDVQKQHLNSDLRLWYSLLHIHLLQLPAVAEYNSSETEPQQQSCSPDNNCISIYDMKQTSEILKDANANCLFPSTLINYTKHSFVRIGHFGYVNVAEIRREEAAVLTWETKPVVCQLPGKVFFMDETEHQDLLSSSIHTLYLLLPLACYGNIWDDADSRNGLLFPTTLILKNVDTNVHGHTNNTNNELKDASKLRGTAQLWIIRCWFVRNNPFDMQAASQLMIPASS